MKRLSINYVAALLLITAGTSFAKSKSKQPGAFTHYGTHMVTSYGATIGVSVGCGLAYILAEDLVNSVDKVNLYRVSGVTLINLAAISGALYAFYKTPQWTDTYLLDIKRERTLKENMVSFFGRLFLPFGVIITEYIQRTADETHRV